MTVCQQLAPEVAVCRSLEVWSDLVGDLRAILRISRIRGYGYGPSGERRSWSFLEGNFFGSDLQVARSGSVHRSSGEHVALLWAPRCWCKKVITNRGGTEKDDVDYQPRFTFNRGQDSTLRSPIFCPTDGVHPKHRRAIRAVTRASSASSGGR